jgi:hypothetical protein
VYTLSLHDALPISPKPQNPINHVENELILII